MNGLARTRRPGIDYTESSIEWPADLKAAVIAQLSNEPWRLYPASQPEQARSRLAGLLDVDVDRIRFTSGADEAVDAIVRRAARSTPLWVPSPAYPGYRRSATRHQADIHEYDAQLTVDAVRTLIGANPARVIFTWPGNPVGHPSPPRPDGSGSLSWTIDATYLSVFSAEFASLVAEGSGVFDVIFSFSKVEGLAGVRLGGIVHASKDLAHERDEPAFPLNTLQLATADVLLSPCWRSRIAARHRAVRSQHGQVLAAVRRLGWRVFPSPAISFVTVVDPLPGMTDTGRDAFRSLSLHTKRFVDEGLLRITACDHNITSLATFDSWRDR